MDFSFFALKKVKITFGKTIVRFAIAWIAYVIRTYMITSHQFNENDCIEECEFYNFVDS